MNWLKAHKRSAWIIGLTLLVPMIFYLNIVFGLVGLRGDYQSRVEALEPRVARLLGLIENEELLRAATGEVDKRVINLVYPATQDRATVSANLQKDLRQILVDAGLSVTNSQVLQVREREVFDYISVKMTVTGDLSGLDAALVSMGEYLPLVLVESMDVWPRRATRRVVDAADQTITATLQLLSLRAVQ